MLKQFGRDPIDPTLWHKCDPPWFATVTLVDGTKANPGGQLWRRQRPDGAWEYQQDPESLEDWMDSNAAP